ncbi:MAG: tRNA (adenosine(37)-N6)-dimethylallyltransferase MiaA [Acidobacteriota bacterium]
MRTSDLVAVLGPTATGKSAVGLALAERLGGEILNCDSTAVYRGLDIGTDKLPADARRGIAHHLIDIVEPTAQYTAADFARDAASAAADVRSRGRLPILVGGTGFYFRALTRGLFPGPGKHPALRRRLEEIAGRRGDEFLWRMVKRVDAPSAARIMRRDRKRLVRALEVYFQTGRPLTQHFAQTASLLDPSMRVHAVALRLPADVLSVRLAARVDAQLASGVVEEVQRLMARGVPETAQALSGLVYRQVLEHLRGVRDLAASRDLIVRENRRYARRQLIWFRKEPNLMWFDGPGESQEVQARIFAWLADRGLVSDGRSTPNG